MFTGGGVGGASSGVKSHCRTSFVNLVTTTNISMQFAVVSKDKFL